MSFSAFGQHRRSDVWAQTTAKLYVTRLRVDSCKLQDQRALLRPPICSRAPLQTAMLHATPLQDRPLHGCKTQSTLMLQRQSPVAHQICRLHGCWLHGRNWQCTNMRCCAVVQRRHGILRECSIHVRGSGPRTMVGSHTRRGSADLYCSLTRGILGISPRNLNDCQGLFFPNHGVHGGHVLVFSESTRARQVCERRYSLDRTPEERLLIVNEK